MESQQSPQPEDGGHPNILVNDNPLSGIFSNVTEFFAAYGWFLLIGVVVILYLKNKLTPTIQDYRRRRDELSDIKKYDPDKAQSRLEAMEASRRRMQEQLDAQAARHAEQMKLKEEKERQQRIDDWDGHQQGKGYRSKYKPKPEEQKAEKSKPNPLRQSDYNPLSGGDSCAWRPGQRRGGGGGGG